MTIRVTLSDEAERMLKQRSAQSVQDAEAIATRLLERSLLGAPDLAKISGEITERFATSGLSEDDLATILEREKHEMRHKRLSGS